MAVITPVGSNFDWSPKSGKLTKTASTGAPSKTDKDLLYEAAKIAVKAQMMDLGNDIGSSAPCEGTPCDSVDSVEIDVSEDSEDSVEIDVSEDGVPGEVVKEVGVSDIVPKDPASETIGDEKAEGAAVQDVQKAVKDLVDKANKAEEIAVKVQDAVANMEEAVNAVKDAVGSGEIAGEIADEVEIEIEDDEGGGNPFGGDKGDEDKCDKDEDECDEDKGDEDEIIKESKDKDDKPEMKSAASGSDDFVKLSSLSKSVKQKIHDYWKNDLGYAPDYVKLLVTDN